MPFLEYIPSGWQGTDQTIRRMRELAIDAARNWGFIKIASVVISDLPARAYKSHAARILDYVKRKIMWVPDPMTGADGNGIPQGMELVQAPMRSLERKAGDCIPLGQKIVVRNRQSGLYSVTPVGDLAEKHNQYDALSYAHNDRKWVFSPITQWVFKGKRPVVRVRLQSGPEFECTNEHKVWLLQGSAKSGFSSLRAPLSEQNVIKHCGVINAHRIPALGSTPVLTAEQLLLEGFYLAEGYSETQRKAEVSNKTQELIGLVEKCLIELEIPYRIKTRPNGVTVINIKASWLTDRLHNLFGNKSYLKHIPEEYLSLSESAIDLLLAAYGAGDAFIPTEKHKNWVKHIRCAYTTTSKELVNQLVFMHMLVGRPVSFYQPSNPQTWTNYRVWSVIDRNLHRSTSHKEKLPGLEGQRVKKIVDSGEKDVCDISVAGTRNFVTEHGTMLSNCDDQATLISALAMAVGIPAEFVTIKADYTRPSEFSHVYPRLLVNGVWVGADASVPTSVLGWEPERYLEKQAWRI